jgi:hypothetical protein
MISTNKKIIFLHIPKTAGTSVETAFRTRVGGNIIMGGKQTPWDYHTSVRSYEEKLPDFDKYFVFTFVRNPWDRLYSWFAMLMNNQKITITDDKFHKWILEDCHSMSSAFPKGAGKMCAQKIPQLEYMKDSEGKNRVDFIGKLEDIGKDFPKVCIQMGINSHRLPHLKRGRHKPYRQAYNEETKQFVQRHHKSDIEAFGYTF